MSSLTGADKRSRTMRAKVWRYPGKAAWHFVTLPRKQSQFIQRAFGAMSRGWGSLPVTVTIGTTSWKTIGCTGKGAQVIKDGSIKRRKKRPGFTLWLSAPDRWMSPYGKTLL